MSSLSRITVYPIKSLDGHELTSCKVLPNGALAGDRRYALVDAWGKYVNGKNCAAIHGIRSTYCNDLKSVTLAHDLRQETFQLETEQAGIAHWCSEVLEKKCRLIENDDGGYPDDCDSPGPTVVSTATLALVASWFDWLDLDETRRRFRFNLELSEVPAFWEDSLVAEAHQVSRFRLGSLTWQGHGLCQRCVVPTRNSQDGAVAESFARDFVRYREEALPAWAPRERFDHFYRLGVNTRIDLGDQGGTLSVADPVEKIH
ncbi:MAG: MOSC domain-containing protein [Bythopirellula sp.]